MEEVKPKLADLLDAWRETTRAAELAERLARLALDAAEQADRNASVSEQIAHMAERAAKAAERAATIAREAASRAQEFAVESRSRRMLDADDAVLAARANEVAARDAYQDAQREARATGSR